jgi:hypothetical protein
VTGRRVVVCGGRDGNRVGLVDYALSVVRRAYGVACIIEGGATGYDRLCRRWAREVGVSVETYEADWNGQGRAAGPKRNQRMIDEGKPDMGVSFPGGRGTADMVRRLRAAGIPVWEVEP